MSPTQNRGTAAPTPDNLHCHRLVMPITWAPNEAFESGAPGMVPSNPSFPIHVRIRTQAVRARRKASLRISRATCTEPIFSGMSQNLLRNRDGDRAHHDYPPHCEACRVE